VGDDLLPANQKGVDKQGGRVNCDFRPGNPHKYFDTRPARQRGAIDDTLCGTDLGPKGCCKGFDVRTTALGALARWKPKAHRLRLQGDMQLLMHPAHVRSTGPFN